VQLTLKPSLFDLFVQVVDDAAPPNFLAGALVSLSIPAVAAQTTDGTGLVQFASLPAGPVQVVATSAGFTQGQAAAGLGPGGGASGGNASAKGLVGAPGPAPQPGPGGSAVVVQLTTPTLDLVIDWGARSQALQAKLKEKQSGPSFWLTDTA